jgi:hypothetical protein
MRIFSKLFGGSKRPDDYYLASSIASTIDAFIISHGIEEFVKGGWSIELRQDWGVSLIHMELRQELGFTLTRMDGPEGPRAAVRLDKLGEWADFKEITMNSMMADGTLDDYATDTFAIAVLRKMKEQIG